MRAERLHWSDEVPSDSAKSMRMSMPAVLSLTRLVPLSVASVYQYSLHPMVIAGQCCQHARISVALFYVGGVFVDFVDVPQVG